MSLSLSDLSARQLRQAAAIKEKIDSLQNQLVQLIGSPAVTASRVGARRRMSRAAIARISAAAKARWAKVKRGAGKAARKSKRRMSATAKARLAAIARERWRKVKAAGRKAL